MFTPAYIRNNNIIHFLFPQIKLPISDFLPVSFLRWAAYLRLLFLLSNIIIFYGGPEWISLGKQYQLFFFIRVSYIRNDNNIKLFFQIKLPSSDFLLDFSNEQHVWDSFCLLSFRPIPFLQFCRLGNSYNCAVLGCECNLWWQ